MFTLSVLTRRYTAVTFLVIFLHVLVGQCVCAAMGPRQAAQEQSAMPMPAGGKHAACHAAAQAAKRHNRQVPAGSHGSSQHECCKAKLTAVLAGLQAPTDVKAEIPAPLWLALPPTLDFTFARFTSWNRAEKVLLVPPQHLKPKIPDIRIFIQSLTV
ncbi:hypothetical protein [Hymenobacter koreensis]|uniref:Secreted protein n=1 Tax=Hymenobacter koreensis TaxID=1084523 RepID=A0ABP8IYX0_9BACT